MPIRKLTDRNPEYVRLGVIHKGLPKEKRVKDGREYEVVGRDTDYFRVVFTEQYQAYVPAFENRYGKTPTEFRNVKLLGETPDTIFDAWMVESQRSKMLHKCDGEVQDTRWQDGEYVHDNAPCVNAKLHTLPAGVQSCNCHEHGALKLVLMDFTIDTGLIGYFLLGTTSFFDVLNISQCMNRTERDLGVQGWRWVVGRAPKTVPVRDPKNPKDRILKKMNLLYIMAEPEQTKRYLIEEMNRRDTLLLSGGVDGSTGELTSPALPPVERIAIAATVPDADPFVPPENDVLDVDVEPIGYDLGELEDATVHLFDHAAHWQNAISNMQETGELTGDMDIEQAIAAVKLNRRERRNEKLGDGSWWKDKELVKEFVSAVNTVYPQMSNTDILAALNASEPDSHKTKYSQFKDTPKPKAWAYVLIAGQQGDYDSARAMANDPDTLAWITDIEMESVGAKITEAGNIEF